MLNIKNLFAYLRAMVFVFMICIGLCCASYASAYKVSVIGLPYGYDSSQAIGITDNGSVFLSLSGSNGNGWEVWNPNTEQERIELPDSLSILSGISNSGAIVGQRNQDTAVLIDTTRHIHDLANLDGFTVSWASAINDAGLIAGYSSYNAVLWQADGTPIALAGSEYFPATARALSENGLVLYTQDDLITNTDTSGNQWMSIGNRRSYIWKHDGTVQQLSQLVASEGISSGGRAINNLGQVVGTSGGHAILWNSDGSIAADMGIGEAYDINNRGQIVGTLNGHAVLWDIDGSVIDFGDSYSVIAINDNGWIAGCAYSPNTGMQAVLWEPVPEPSSILALLCGIAGTGILKFRKRK